MSSIMEETEKQIRALLLSAPRGLTVPGIQKDFKTMLGKALPFRELGFATPEDLFRAMPDVVRPTWVDGELILRGVSDITTRHIERMVSRQKVSSKTKRGYGDGSHRRTGGLTITLRLRTNPVPRPWARLQAQYATRARTPELPTRPATTTFSYPARPSATAKPVPTSVSLPHTIPGPGPTSGTLPPPVEPAATHPPADPTAIHQLAKPAATVPRPAKPTDTIPPPPKPATTGTAPRSVKSVIRLVPAFTRWQIKTLFLSHPGGILSSQLDAAMTSFISQHGSTINWAKLGFKNSLEMVRSVPDIVRVEELSGGECRMHSQLLPNGGVVVQRSHAPRGARQVTSVAAVPASTVQVASVPASTVPAHVPVSCTKPVPASTVRAHVPVPSLSCTKPVPASTHYQDAQPQKTGRLTEVRDCISKTVPLTSTGASRLRSVTSGSSRTNTRLCQSSPCSVRENTRDTEFGNYVAAQLQLLPDGDAKELLKLEIQKLLRNVSMLRLQQPVAQAIMTQGMTA